MYFIAMSRTPSLFENKPLAPPLTHTHTHTHTHTQRIYVRIYLFLTLHFFRKFESTGQKLENTVRQPPNPKGGRGEHQQWFGSYK